jgi:uncharacterized phage protein (TIGR01671 family)
MAKKNKYKLYNTKTNEIVDYINCSISIADGTVQSFNSKGDMEGTANNLHLIPLEYTGKKDIDKREIYEDYIVKREVGALGDEEIIGAVVFCECSWWIENEKEQRAVPLFSETAIDRVIGNIYQNSELLEDKQ